MDRMFTDSVTSLSDSLEGVHAHAINTTMCKPSPLDHPSILTVMINLPCQEEAAVLELPES